MLRVQAHMALSVLMDLIYTWSSKNKKNLLSLLFLENFSM